MKEVFRHYGSCVIAVVTAVVLMGLIVGLPLGTVAEEKQDTVCTVEGHAFEQYWRNQ